MTLSATDTDLIRASFRMLEHQTEPLGRVFYGHLFAIAPAVRPLFAADIAAQSDKLTAMLTFVVGKLDQLATLVPAVQALGRRHVGYGAKPQHYAAVASALDRTLQDALGEAYDAPTRAAWGRAVATLSEIMIDAALAEGPARRADPAVGTSAAPMAALA